MAWRRKPLSEEEILASPMLSYPLTQYMFCSPAEGGVALVLCRADLARRFTDRPVFLEGGRRPLPALRELRGAGAVARARARRRADGRRVAGRVRDRRASVPRTSTSPSCRTPRPAPRSCTWPRTASAPTATRSGGSPRAPPRSAAACRSTPTAAAWPTASPSARRACARSTRTCSSCGATPAMRQVPGDPRVAYTHVYGAPGISGVTILTR